MKVLWVRGMLRWLLLRWSDVDDPTVARLSFSESVATLIFLWGRCLGVGMPNSSWICEERTADGFVCGWSGVHGAVDSFRHLRVCGCSWGCRTQVCTVHVLLITNRKNTCMGLTSKGWHSFYSLWASGCSGLVVARRANRDSKRLRQEGKQLQQEAGERATSCVSPSNDFLMTSISTLTGIVQYSRKLKSPGIYIRSQEA